jgi:hypothetical protein
MIATKPPINPVDIYDQYLALNSELKTIERKIESNGRYSASGAGMCTRKHWYGNQDYDRKTRDARSNRLLRLGTIMGEDFDAAMHWFKKDRLQTQDSDEIKDIDIYWEEPVSCERLNLHGHFDLLIVQDRKGYLYDYKTSHSFKFKQLFGRNKLDGSPSNNYEYQLGTYGFMLEEASGDQNYCDEIVYMSNIYINKDNSVVKSKQADLNYKEWAKDYWEKVHNSKNAILPPSFGTWAPVYKWECGKYCDFSEICDSPYKKKE